MNIFLVRDSRVADVEKSLTGYQTVEMIDGFDGRAIPFTSGRDDPAWLGEVRTLVKDPNRLNLRTEAAGVMFLISRRNCFFVVTVGIAWQRLRDEWLQPDFGRRIARLAIPRVEVVSLTAEQVFARWHVATERAPRAAPLDEFSVEPERDLVSAIEGRPALEHRILGEKLRGSTGLRLKVQVHALGAVLDHVAHLYKNGAYSEEWPELDNLMPIRDETEIAACNAALDQTLSAPKPNRHIILSAPTTRRGDANLAESYAVGRLTRNVSLSPYLTFDSWTSYLNRIRRLPSVQQARLTKVHLLDTNNDAFDDYCVYDCMGYEATVNGRVVILSSGVWYQVAKAFLDRINKSVRDLKMPPYTLPNWDGKDREGLYNKKCVNTTKDLLLFDVKLIAFGGGASRFEFCDLMHTKKRILYFVKIPSRSSDLSHLVEQTRRTAELLFDPDDGFRKKLKAKIKDVYPRYDTRWLNSRPKPGDWNLCLVALGREARDMPMFAKCSLTRLTRDMLRAGHTVSFQAA